MPYSVLALGSSAYVNFCSFGIAVNDALEAINGKRLLPLVKADARYGQDKTFKNWAVSSFSNLCQFFNLEIDSKAKKNWPFASGNLKSTILKNLRFRDMHQLHPVLLKDKTVESTILINSEQISARHWVVTIGFPANSKVALSPGDHVYVFPENDPVLVEKVLKRLTGDTSRKMEWNAESGIPPSTVETALTKYLDLTATPTETQIEQWICCSQDKYERKRLQKFLSNQIQQCQDSWRKMLYSSSHQTLDQWALKGKPSVLDFLELFPNLKIPVDIFVASLSKMLPRPYSVARSSSGKPLSFKGKHYIVTDLVYEQVLHKSMNGGLHLGTCTGFLSSMDIGQRFLTYKYQNEHFKMPPDLSTPLLMIATGSGIAPFRSFWQSRGKEEGCINVKLDWLYFGCRNEDEALFYEEATFHVNVRMAFSRRTDMKKTYVQDLLRLDSIHIFNLIVNQQANVYICGKTAMVSAVEDALNEVLGQSGCQSTNVEAMKTNGKLMEEHFG